MRRNVKIHLIIKLYRGIIGARLQRHAFTSLRPLTVVVTRVYSVRGAYRERNTAIKDLDTLTYAT